MKINQAQREGEMQSHYILDTNSSSKHLAGGAGYR
jgi:hypothetical protein